MHIATKSGNFSYWTSTASPAPPCASLAGNHTVDVTIIGGGYSGLSTALHLLEAGAKALVIEAREIGEEASGRNNGQVIPALKKEDPSAIMQKLGHGPGRAMVTMMRQAADYVFHLVRHYGIDCDAEQSGWIQPAHSPRHMKVIENRVSQWESLGANVQLLDRVAISERLGSKFYIGGWRAPAGGHIQPLAYARGLASAVIRNGGEVYIQSPATNIARKGKRWIVKTPGGSINTDQVIVATQGATPESLWRGLSSSIIPITFYQLATQPLSKEQRNRVIPGREAMSDMQGDIHFLRYDRSHRLITGGTFIHSKNWAERLNKIVRGRMRRLFPYLPDLAFSHHWAGTAALTTDFYPHLYSLAPGVWSWTGCNARGISLTTSMGKAMADLVLHGPSNNTPLPVESLRNKPLNAIIARLSLYALLYYRANDFWYRTFSSRNVTKN